MERLMKPRYSVDCGSNDALIPRPNYAALHGNSSSSDSSPSFSPPALSPKSGSARGIFTTRSDDGRRPHWPKSFRVTFVGSLLVETITSQSKFLLALHEIKKRATNQDVNLEIIGPNVRAVDYLNQDVVIFEHKLQCISRFAQTAQDHCSFTYLTNENPRDTNTQRCYLFHACSENTVQDLFASMRESTKDIQSHQQQHHHHPLTNVGSTSSSSLVKCAGSLPNLQSLQVAMDPTNNSCQHFEVLYIGKIKVSHCKAPPTFIDEALERFRQHEMEKLRLRAAAAAAQNRQRHGSGTVISPTNGSSSSQNIDKPLERSTSVRENELRHQIATLAASSSSNGSAVTSSSSSENLVYSPSNSSSSESLSKAFPRTSPSSTAATTPTAHLSKSSSSSSFAHWLLGSAEDVGPTSTRARANSGDAGRTRAPSGGSSNELAKRGRSDTAPASTSTAPGSEQNRTMLFQISASELSLISLDKKLVILQKGFKDISHCSQGIKHTDYFGFICRDPSTNTEAYVGYVFKCQSQSVTDEIMGALKQAFSTAAQLCQHTTPSSNAVKGQFCETCPMLWFYRLCTEVEGSSPNRVHSIIQKHVESMSEEEQRELKDKFEGAEVSNAEAQNEVMLMLIRALFETKQSKHGHTGELIFKADLSVLDRKHSSVLDDLRKKAKRSLTSSFENILKAHRKPREEAREMFRERSQTIDMDSPRPRTQPSLGNHSPVTSRPRKDSMFETTTDSAFELQPRMRPRSSTIGGSTDIKRERCQPASTPPVRPKPSPMMNIFMKVGNQAKTPSPEEKTTPQRKLSWRQAIYQRVVTPQHKSMEELSPRMAKASLGDDAPYGGTGEAPPTGKRSPATLRALWKKAIMEQILLIRMEKENRKLRASQDAVQNKRMKLDYEEITPCLKEVTKVWEDMLASPGRPGELMDYQKIVDAVKAGIPRNKRGEIWQLLSEQQRLRNTTPVCDETELNVPYDDLLRQLTSHQHAILIDLGRTFPHHPYFSQALGPGQLALFNLLKAYSLLDKEVGYCQGLSFIAGVLLLHQMEENLAFEMLKHILFQRGIRLQYKPDMVALQIQMYQLSRLVHDTYPDLYQHFEKQEIAPTLYAAPWFLTMFASQFPLGFVARVFDLLFLYGMEVVFKVALVLLGNHKELIMQCSSFESVMEFLKTTLPSLGIIQMERVFNQVFTMDISRELHAYEVEYQVLQEEMFSSSSPTRSDPDTVQQLETTNQSLKRENSELQEQLEAAQSNINHLETMMSTYQTNISHLEMRVRELELDRLNLKRTVETIRRRLPEIDTFCSEPDLLTQTSPDLLSNHVQRSSSHQAVGSSGCGDHLQEDVESPSSDKEVANTLLHLNNGSVKCRERYASGDSPSGALSLTNSPIME